jgi:hypothetical protein
VYPRRNKKKNENVKKKPGSMNPKKPRNPVKPRYPSLLKDFALSNKISSLDFGSSIINVKGTPYKYLYRSI